MTLILNPGALPVVLNVCLLRNMKLNFCPLLSIRFLVLCFDLISPSLSRNFSVHCWLVSLSLPLWLSVWVVSGSNYLKLFVVNNFCKDSYRKSWSHWLQFWNVNFIWTQQVWLHRVVNKFTQFNLKKLPKTLQTKFKKNHQKKPQKTNYGFTWLHWIKKQLLSQNDNLSV